MWKLASISRAWVLFLGDKIVIAARQGKIYSADGTHLADNNLQQYASTHLGVPKDILRVTELSEEMMTACSALLAKLPPIDATLTRHKKTASPSLPPEVPVPKAPKPKPVAPERLRVPVIVREKLPETDPEPTPVPLPEETPLPSKPPESEPLFSDPQSYRHLVKTVAEAMDCQTVDLSSGLMILSKDRYGQACVAVVRHLDIEVPPLEDGEGMATATRNRKFVDKLKAAVTRRKSIPTRAPAAESTTP